MGRKNKLNASSSMLREVTKRQVSVEPAAFKKEQLQKNRQMKPKINRVELMGSKAVMTCMAEVAKTLNKIK